MARYADFKAAEAVLKAAFAALEDREAGQQNYSVAVAPISGTDVYYTDGDAAKWIGKILLMRGELARGYFFFDEAGPCDTPFPPKYDACFRAWIASVAARQTPSSPPPPQ